MLSGNGAPEADLGEEGEFYVDLDTTTLHGPKGPGGWGSGVALVGADGATGAAGRDGIDGNRIRTGAGAPANSLGVDGDLYLDTGALELYVRDGGAWSSAGTLHGPKGDRGEQGPRGPAGPAGEKGPAGPGGTELLFAGGRSLSATANRPAGLHVIDSFTANRHSTQDETIAFMTTMNVNGVQETSGTCMLRIQSPYQRTISARFHVQPGSATALTLQASVYRPTGSEPFNLELVCDSDQYTAAGTYQGAVHSAYASPGNKLTP